MNEFFPKTLRELFSYDGNCCSLFMDLARRINVPQAGKVVQLVTEHGLLPLDKYNENLNRFLAFIGKS